MILCVCTESEAEVEDVLWNRELPIINRTRAGRGWSDLPSAKLTKLGSLPLMDPIAPSVTATIFSSALHWGPCLLLIDVSALCFYLLNHMIVKYRIQEGFILGIRGTIFLTLIDTLMSKLHPHIDWKSNSGEETPAQPKQD